MTDTPDPIVPIGDREIATINAALRYYQHRLPNEQDAELKSFIEGIATNIDTLEPLSEAEIDRLLETINGVDDDTVAVPDADS